MAEKHTKCQQRGAPEQRRGTNGFVSLPTPYEEPGDPLRKKKETEDYERGDPEQNAANAVRTNVAGFGAIVLPETDGEKDGRERYEPETVFRKKQARSGGTERGEKSQRKATGD